MAAATTAQTAAPAGAKTLTKEQIDQKLASMKKTRKRNGILTKIAAAVAMIVLVAYNFLPVTYIQSPTGTDFEQGFSFPGWQMIFYGIGRQYIMHGNLFNPNPFTIVGMLGTFIVLAVCTKRYSYGRNKSKAQKEFVSAAFLIYSALVLGALIVPVAKTAATGSDKLFDFTNRYLNNAEVTFTSLPYAWVTFVVLLLVAIFKIANGVFLLYQKNFAAQYAPKKAKESNPHVTKVEAGAAS